MKNKSDIGKLKIYTFLKINRDSIENNNNVIDT